MNKIKLIFTKIVYALGIITSGLLILFLLFIVFKKAANPENANFSYNDGPYLFYLNDSTIQSLSVKQTTANKFSIEEYVLNLKDSASLKQALSKLPEPFNPSDSFPASTDFQFHSDKIAVISDIHGSFHNFEALLQANKLINDSSDWTWGNGHLVINGDVFDKGPYVTDCFWLIKKLESQAEKNGGRVHFLLGNHERLVLSGQTEYVNFKYRKICEKLLINYNQLYDTDTYLGKWLRSKSTAIKINNNLFVHGGISNELIVKNYSLKDINHYITGWISSENPIQLDTASRANIRFLINYFGPMEYRGYFNKNIMNRGQSSGFPEQSVDAVLNHFAVRHIIVGHTIVKKIRGMFDNKIIAVNTGFPKDDEMSEDSDSQLLIIEDAKYYVAGMNGKRQLLFSE